MDDLRRVRAIAHEVPKAVDLRDAACLDVGKHRGTLLTFPHMRGEVGRPLGLGTGFPEREVEA